jgi:hypothetical protein
MSLRDQVGPDVARFLRWLVDRGDWSVKELVDLLEDPAAWEPEFDEWTRASSGVPIEELQGEDRANRLDGEWRP